MITTSALIGALSANLPPVHRLRPPLTRTGCWLLLAAVVLALLAISQGIRPDLAQRMAEPFFVVSMAASVTTGVLAAVAAFMVSLPDRSRLWPLLPIPPLLVWLSTVGYQCLTGWIALDPNSVQLGEAARCFATLVLTGLPLSLAMLLMLRHAAPLRPMLTIITGSLAVGAITAAALSLFHELDATIMILMWNIGTATLIVGLAGALNRRLLSRTLPVSPLQHD